MVKDKAVRALKAYMDRTKRGPSEIAETLGVDRTLIWRWAMDERKPNRENVKAIAQLVRLPVVDLL